MIPGVVASQTSPPPPPPAWLPANTVAWFDASDASTVVTDQGDVVGWKSKLNTADRSLTLDPYTDRGAATYGDVKQNGLNTMSFNGSGGFWNTGLSLNASNCMMIGVARTRSGGSHRTWMSFGGIATGLALTQTGEPGNTGWGLLVCYVEWWMPIPAVPDVFHMQTLTVAANAATIRKDRAQIGAKTIGPNPADPQMNVGGDDASGTFCDICELIFVSGAWTVAERDAVETQFRTKWATA
jgi:hypothetical protein